LFLPPALSLVLLQCHETPEKSSYSCIVSRAQSTIVINGVLDEETWQHIEKTFLKINTSAEEVTDSTQITWFKTCYDARNLYIAFECNDLDIWSDFTRRDDHLWEYDAVEIFIDSDGRRNTYYEIQVSPKNVLFDAHLQIPEKTNDDEIISFDAPGIQTAVAIDCTLNMRDDTDKKWTVEIAIPVSDLSKEQALLGSDGWHINFFRMNKDKKRETEDLAWSPTAGNFHTPSKFGYLKFQHTN